MLEVYTDGACSGNPGPGGWAWAVVDGDNNSGAEANTTNQRMELTAVYEAIKSLEGEIKIVSDSNYVVKCFNDKWYVNWQRRGWKNSKNDPVANRDLWMPVIEMYLDRKNEITFKWVKGHSGDPMNDLVDSLAVDAIKKL